jgi:hypothetical protein
MIPNLSHSPSRLKIQTVSEVSYCQILQCPVPHPHRGAWKSLIIVLNLKSPWTPRTMEPPCRQITPWWDTPQVGAIISWESDRPLKQYEPLRATLQNQNWDNDQPDHTSTRTTWSNYAQLSLPDPILPLFKFKAYASTPEMVWNACLPSSQNGLLIKLLSCLFTIPFVCFLCDKGLDLICYYPWSWASGLGLPLCFLHIALFNTSPWPSLIQVQAIIVLL